MKFNPEKKKEYKKFKKGLLKIRSYSDFENLLQESIKDGLLEEKDADEFKVQVANELMRANDNKLKWIGNMIKTTLKEVPKSFFRKKKWWKQQKNS